MFTVTILINGIRVMTESFPNPMAALEWAEGYCRRYADQYPNTNSNIDWEFV